MQMPLKKYRIGLKHGQPYGSILSKLLGNKHTGVDLLPNGDDEIKPMDDGVILLAMMTPGSCGGLIDIQYDNGLKSRYCHLQKLQVSTGVRVTKNTVAGIMGATGTSYPKGYKHLHWVVWKDGKTIDPLSLDYDTTDIPLISKVNSIFRSVWGRQPLPKESGYFQFRVTTDIKDERQLLNTMKFWHSKSRVLFILELQKNGFY